MWERLLNLFKNKTPEDQTDQEELFSEQTEDISTDQPQAANTSVIKAHGGGSYNGPGRLIGFNYLKRRGENEESPRKFINLGKLLRGNYK